MCGIAGQINLDPRKPVSREALALMSARLQRRGPDAEGVWIDGPVGLAHRRLSIIDLSEAANQPMGNEDGSIQIVFNGEIYNFLELRAELMSRGHVFQSRSDTETLVHLYEDEGTEMLSRLRGMFAFAIWDGRRKILFAVRDRLGKKPFKYYVDGDKFLFASELKAIRAHPEARVDVDEGDAHQYLGFGYVFAPNTGFRQIKKLPPAHYLILKDGRLTIQRYWQLDFRNTTSLRYEECRERIIDLLDEAVRLRLISDVPLGAFLSGGVDSSAVVAMMARHSTEPVRTFSIGFDCEEASELPYARQIAEQFSTRHTEHVVRVNAAEILPDLVRLYEEPYADSSALPSYYLAQVTRQSVTVALNGDGGDENFCGYERYHLYAVLQRLTRTVLRVRLGWLVSLIRALPGSFFANVARRAGVVAQMLDAPPERVYTRLISMFSDGRKADMYAKSMKERTAELTNASLMSPCFGSEAAGLSSMNHALLWDFENYLPEDLCAKMDLATMAHGLEARSPFLDHRFVEFCATIPPEWKYRRGNKKRILKEALAPILPHDILYRKKQGFAIPIHQWFRGELGTLWRDALLAPGARITSLIEPKALAGLIDAHAKGRSDEGYRLWALLVLELWLRET